MRIFKLFLATIFILALIFIGFQNPDQKTTLYLFQWHLENYPLIIILFATLALGLFLASLVGIIDEIRLRRTIWRQKKEIKGLRSELSALRNLPIVQAEEEEKREAHLN